MRLADANGDAAKAALDLGLVDQTLTRVEMREYLIERIGEIFSLHKLAMEDVVNLHQRAKAEEFDDHIFLVTRIVRSTDDFGTEQMCVFLGSDYVLSFQERPGDCFDPLRQRIRNGKGRIRTTGADYLCYALLDAVVDDYFPVLEHKEAAPVAPVTKARRCRWCAWTNTDCWPISNVFLSAIFPGW